MQGLLFYVHQSDCSCRKPYFAPVEPSKKTVIVIAGPTAVGKTAIGIQVAKHFATEIISADSRQCYREMKIGVARPSEAELKEVPHHFIASHSIHEKVTAASFEDYALEKAAEILKKHDHLVMVGGTGLYIKAFLEGMDEIPEVPEEIHHQVVTRYNDEGMPWLQNEIARLDPAFWEKGETKNPQRMMRALEVVLATGRSVLHFRTGEKKQRDFSVIKIALELPREELYRNINHRVDLMMEAGLLEEVKGLYPHHHLNALQTVGYKELFQYLDSEADLAAAVDEIKKNTRHYAKRQLTWFRKDREYSWSEPDFAKVLPLLDQKPM